MKPKVAVASLILFMLLSCYSVSWNEKNYRSFDYIFAHPEYEGRGIVLDEVRVVKTSDEGFFIEKDGLTVEVKGFAGNPRQTGIVSVKGILRISEGYVEATQVHYHRNLYFKYLLSPVGFAVLLYFFFKDWRITKRGAEEK